jgi:LPS export ABC transporter protein LptC
MLLKGDVEVYSVNEFGNRTVMSTESLDIDFDKEQLSTEQPVRVETEGLSQTSIGMFADLTKDEIVFYRDIQGTYEPEQPN